MADKIGIAFAGCVHPHIFPRIDILANEPDVDLVGCYDSDPNLAAAFEKQYGLKAFSSIEELLDRPNVNLVIVEGAEPENPGYVRQAVQRNQAVLLEKPGAPTLQQMQALLNDIRDKPVVFQVAYMMRYSSAISFARRILTDNVLGTITAVRFHAAAPVGGAAEMWQSVAGNVGGVAYTIGCHMIHLMVHLLGMPRQLKAMTLKLPPGAPVLAHGFKKDTLSGLGQTVEMPVGGLMYEDGLAAILDYGDKLVTYDITGWEAHPWIESWSIELYGTDGTLYVGVQPSRYRLYIRNPKPGYTSGWHSWENDEASTVGNSLLADERYLGETKHLLNRIRTGDTNNIPWIAEAEGVVTVLDAMYRSAQQGDSIIIEK